MKKVFPMEATTRSARQRADMMLRRDAGINNLAPSEEPPTQQHQQAVYDPDNQGEHTIQMR
jgi:hypothetical protein